MGKGVVKLNYHLSYLKSNSPPHVPMSLINITLKVEAIRRDFESVGPTLFKNPLDARWGLLPTLRWVGSWLPTYLATLNMIFSVVTTLSCSTLIFNSLIISVRHKCATTFPTTMSLLLSLLIFFHILTNTKFVHVTSTYYHNHYIR